MSDRLREPKPCPFCGREPKECVTMRVWDPDGLLPTIACDYCGIEIRRKTRAAVVRCWNKRAALKEEA
jgi:hypothetical protein